MKYNQKLKDQFQHHPEIKKIMKYKSYYYYSYYSYHRGHFFDNKVYTAEPLSISNRCSGPVKNLNWLYERISRFLAR